MSISTHQQREGAADARVKSADQNQLLEAVWAEVYMTRLRQISRSLADAERGFENGILRGPPRTELDHADAVWSTPKEPLSAFAMYVVLTVEEN